MNLALAKKTEHTMPASAVMQLHNLICIVSRKIRSLGHCGCKEAAAQLNEGLESTSSTWDSSRNEWDESHFVSI